jgi:hypothetical protein
VQGDSKNTPATVFQDFLKVAVREVRGRFMSVIASPQVLSMRVLERMNLREN